MLILSNGNSCNFYIKMQVTNILEIFIYKLIISIRIIITVLI